MTIDDRLNQLEPLLSEALTVLDRHTFQLKQLNGAVSQLSTVISKQGDNISFLLREQLVMKGDIVEIKGDIVEIKGDIVEMKGNIVEIKGDIVEMKGQQDGMNNKLDHIIQLLQKPGQ